MSRVRIARLGAQTFSTRDRETWATVELVNRTCT